MNLRNIKMISHRAEKLRISKALLTFLRWREKVRGASKGHYGHRDTVQTRGS